MILRRLGRLAAAAALLTTTAGVLAAAPAGAANTNITQDCVQQYTNLSVGNSDTVTISISGSSCAYIIFNNPPGGALGTATLNTSISLVPGTPIGIADGDTVVYTAPASGSGNDGFGFMANLQTPPSIFVNITFPPGSGSLVDNGDGTATVTYAGDVALFFFAAGSTCAPELSGPTEFLYVADSQAPPDFALPTSPGVISTASGVMQFRAAATTLPAGSYQGCLYDTSAMPGPLLASAALSIGQAAPTTTTTAGTDPIRPSFTG